MRFTSFIFVLLLLLTFTLYYLPFLRKWQIQILIISSLLFYAYHQPELVFLLLFSISVNVVSSYLIVYGNPRFKKRYAIAGVVINLFILIFFKYGPLVSRSFFSSANPVGEFLLTMPLPIGISFFTFQGISLVIDVFNEKYVSNKLLVPLSFWKHTKQILFFKGFFPQLISGPIIKAHDFIPQIGFKKLQNIQWETVFKKLTVGYFLKMVVADNLKDFTFYISFPYFQGYSTLNLIVMLFGYSFQIFADFAGYSLIAIGLAKLFGYDFMENFNFPYISTSFKQFWKRWHISLSTFLMEYLYFPLGGNRKGKLRTYLNLMIVMFLGGLWHGAAWSYAVWGSFHGLALALERFFSPAKERHHDLITKFVKGIFVFAFVTLAWLLFKLPDFNQVIEYFKSIRHNGSIPIDFQLITYILMYSLPVLIYHLIYLIQAKPMFTRFQKFSYLAYALMLFLMLTNSGSPGAFIYFQF